MQKAIIYTLTLLSYCIIQTAIAQTDPTPGQNRLDSLQHLLSITKQDTAKINILNNLAQQYVDRGNMIKQMQQHRKHWRNPIARAIKNSEVIPTTKWAWFTSVRKNMPAQENVSLKQ